MQVTVESNPKRFRNIILYGGVQKSKGKINLKFEDKMKKFVIFINKFKARSIFLIDFKFSSDIFVQIIQKIK